MARDQIRKDILTKFRAFQEGKDEPVWVSGRQLTDLFSKYNPSSVRMALTLLHDQGLLVRERRKGRGPKGKTGQSAWYSLTDDWVVLERGLEEINSQLEKQLENQPAKSGG